MDCLDVFGGLCILVGLIIKVFVGYTPNEFYVDPGLCLVFIGLFILFTYHIWLRGDLNGV